MPADRASRRARWSRPLADLLRPRRPPTPDSYEKGRNQGSFPTEEAACKLIYLASTTPCRNGPQPTGGQKRCSQPRSSSEPQPAEVAEHTRGGLRPKCLSLPTVSCTQRRETLAQKASVVGVQRGPIPVLLAGADCGGGGRVRRGSAARSPGVERVRLRRAPRARARSVVASPTTALDLILRPLLPVSPLNGGGPWPDASRLRRCRRDRGDGETS